VAFDAVTITEQSQSMKARYLDVVQFDGVTGVIIGDGVLNYPDNEKKIHVIYTCDIYM
jgi:hypothetical protein